MIAKGIKHKVVLVLVAVLGFSTALNALLASYLTKRQNELAAFAALDGALLSWQTDLDETSRQMREVAVATVSDVMILDQFNELLTLDFNLANPDRVAERRDLARMLGHRKTASLNRLDIALDAGDFSRIDVYIRGRLSHSISRDVAGMNVVTADGGSVWVSAAVDARGDVPFASWPAWAPSSMPASDYQWPKTPGPPSVTAGFDPAGAVKLRVVVPVQGYAENVMTDDENNPVTRFYSDLAVVGRAKRDTETRIPSTLGVRAAEIVAVVVFEKTLDRAALEQEARKSARFPVILSPDGRKRLLFADVFPLPTSMLDTERGVVPAQVDASVQQIVSTASGSYYLAFRNWRLADQPALLLGLAASRDSTLANMRQTVLAILAAACATMLVGVVIGLRWVRRFIDPVIELTAAVRKITGSTVQDSQNLPARRLQPVMVNASDEVGALAEAFNAMVRALHQAFETLEARVQERTAELRQQERYLRTLIDLLPMRAWFKDTDGRFLAINQAEAERAGRHPKELIGRSDHEVWPTALADDYRNDDLRVMASRERTMREEWRYEANGPAWVEVFKVPVLDDDGSVLGTIGVARDISDRKAAEAAREAALEEAKRLARLRSDFLARMSHELRTPLNGILGFAQILQQNQTLDEHQRKGLRVIEESGRHLLALIDDILDLARIDAGRFELQAVEVELSSFVQSVCDIVRVRAEQKHLQFVCEISGELPHSARVDDKRLRQVLLNLLSNAIKFTDEGGVTLRICAARMTDGEAADHLAKLRFEIRDTGIGMNEAQIERLFQPFEQVGETRRREGGSGLGLAISREIVRRMGGDIEVSSRPGEGSVFAFALALQTADSSDMCPHPNERVTGYLGRRRKVLVIDDVEENRTLLSESLTALGFEVLEADDGAPGIELARHAHPEVVIVDVMMPGLDGFETTRSLRSLSEFAGMPIVGTSASVTHEVEKHFLDVGGNAFLPKPIEMKHLIDLLGLLLGLQWIREPAP